MFLSMSMFKIDSLGFCLLVHKEVDVSHTFTIARRATLWAGQALNIGGCHSPEQIEIPYSYVKC